MHRIPGQAEAGLPGSAVLHAPAAGAPSHASTTLDAVGWQCSTARAYQVIMANILAFSRQSWAGLVDIWLVAGKAKHGILFRLCECVS